MSLLLVTYLALLSDLAFGKIDRYVMNLSFLKLSIGF